MAALMRPSIALAGVLLAGSGVALGASGAHAIKDSLSVVQLGWWQTAVAYQMWHALALLALALMPLRRAGLAAALIAGGVLAFSGSLYVMALFGWRWLGLVTPIGGGAMIAGWAILAVALARLIQSKQQRSER